MLKQPADSDGFVVPDVDPAAAWDAASGLSSVADQVRSALDLLDAAPASAICWSGAAADGYREVRARLARRSAELAEVASAGASIALEWLRTAAPAITELRALAVRGEAVKARLDAAAAGAYDPVLDDALNRELDDVLRRWHQAQDAYWAGVDLAARRLLALRDGITDRPLDGHDQVEGAMRTVWQGYVATPTSMIWSLTGQAFTDREGWWEDVSSVPSDTADAVAALIRDPLGAGRSAVDADAWQEGRYGEAAAAAAMLFLPGPRWLSAGRDVGAVRFAANIADANAPRPTLQTVDEMVDGVDLARHEHHALGHALRRHVDVDDDYLMDRLTHGTLLDDSTRGHIPGSASRFTSRDVAERAITDALQTCQEDLRAFAASPEKALTIEMTFRTPLGEVMTRTAEGFAVRPGSTLIMHLRRTTDGVYIETAYVS